MSSRDRRREKREKFHETNGYRCAYCGGVYPLEMLSVDHIVPVAKGGPDEPSNWLTTCYPCNSRKSDDSIEAFRARVKWEHVHHGQLAGYYERILAGLNNILNAKKEA